MPLWRGQIGVNPPLTSPCNSSQDLRPIALSRAGVHSDFMPSQCQESRLDRRRSKQRSCWGDLRERW